MDLSHLIVGGLTLASVGLLIGLELHSRRNEQKNRNPGLPSDSTSSAAGSKQ